MFGGRLGRVLSRVLINRRGHARDVSVAEHLRSGLPLLGYKDFRPLQLEAMETLISERRVLLVAPTGGGKSLTYQLPAVLMPGTTIVVSPLISLMVDQVQALKARGVAATYIASTLTSQEMNDRLTAVAEGEYKLVYVSAERLTDHHFRAVLVQMQQTALTQTLEQNDAGNADGVPKISDGKGACHLFVVDEAHCISQWGHDFRPEYLRLHEIMYLLPKAHLMACTATATPRVREHILDVLRLPRSTSQVIGGFARPNIDMRIQRVWSRAERDVVVDSLLSEALLQQPPQGADDAGEDRAGGDAFHRQIGYIDTGDGDGDGSGDTTGRGAQGMAIIYASTRKDTEKEAGRLRDQGWNVMAYHAGMSAKERDAASAAFVEGIPEVIVATNAFGMGVDRPDVRLVLHLSAPNSVEEYYQEVGRAGRDGRYSIAMMCYSGQDFVLRRRLLETKHMKAQKGAGGGRFRTQQGTHKWQLFLDLMMVVESSYCRQAAILQYFGEGEGPIGSGEGSSVRCGVCDVCRRNAAMLPEKKARNMRFIRTALSTVLTHDGTYGLTTFEAVLSGENNPKLNRAGLVNIPEFGALAGPDFAEDRDEEGSVMQLLRSLIVAGCLVQSPGQFPSVSVSPVGMRVLNGEFDLEVILPDPPSKGSRPRRRQPSISKKKRELLADLSEEQLQVFEALRKWRKAASEERGTLPHNVCYDKVLHAIVLAMPATLHELGDVKGVGPKKLKTYGREILDELDQF